MFCDKIFWDKIFRDKIFRDKIFRDKIFRDTLMSAKSAVLLSLSYSSAKELPPKASLNIGAIG